MSRATLIVTNDLTRRKAVAWVQNAPWNTVVEFRQSKRTLPQNAKLWAMLTDVAQQHMHAGMRLSPTDWKHLFTAALKRELRMVPNIDGDGFVMLGEKTSEMTKAELGELVDLIAAKGAEWGVTFTDPCSREADGDNSSAAAA